MATVAGHRLLRKDSCENVEKAVCLRYAFDMPSVCLRCVPLAIGVNPINGRCTRVQSIVVGHNPAPLCGASPAFTLIGLACV